MPNGHGCWVRRRSSASPASPRGGVSTTNSSPSGLRMEKRRFHRHHRAGQEILPGLPGAQALGVGSGPGGLNHLGIYTMADLLAYDGRSSAIGWANGARPCWGGHGHILHRSRPERRKAGEETTFEDTGSGCWSIT